MTPTPAQLRKFFPKGKKAILDAIARQWLSIEQAGVKSPKEAVWFLATIDVETQGATRLEENLYYTTAQRIYDVFKGPAKSPRFKSVAACQPYVKNPEKLANFVYANRMGNGPPSSGDGWRYRGSGPIHTTGKYNFTKAGYAQNPDALRDPDAGMVAAGEFWARLKLSRFVKAGDVVGFRKAVNGGTNGLDEFRASINKGASVFPASPQGLTSAISAASTVEEVQAEAAAPDITMTELKSVSGIARISDNDTKLAGAGATVLGGTGVFGWILDRYQDTKTYLQPVFDTFEAIPGSVYFLVIIALLGYMWWRSRTVRDMRVKMERTGESLTTLKAREDAGE